MVETIERSLQKVSLFGGVSEESRRAIERRCKWRSFRPGDQIISYKDGSHNIYFLISGEARVNIYSREGKSIAFRDIFSGDVFGELSAIDRRDRSANVIAKSLCLTASMSPQDFSDVLCREPALALALVTHLVTEIRALTDRVFEFSTLAVRQRLRMELLRLAQRAAPSGNQALLRPAPTHSDIASKISTHREAVSREMSQLARQGLLKRSGSSLIITDIAQLARLCQRGDLMASRNAGEN